MKFLCLGYYRREGLRARPLARAAAEEGMADGRPLICVLVVIPGNYALPSEVH